MNGEDWPLEFSCAACGHGGLVSIEMISTGCCKATFEGFATEEAPTKEPSAARPRCDRCGSPDVRMSMEHDSMASSRGDP